MGSRIFRYSKINVSVLLFSAILLTSTLVSTSPTSNAIPYTLPMIAVSPTSQADSWISNIASKVDAVNSADLDSAPNPSVIIREANAKRQCFTPSGANLSTSPPASITSVTIYVEAARNQNQKTDIQLEVAKGTAINNNDISSGPKETITAAPGNYMPISRIMTTNPFTGVAWTVDEVNNWKLADGTPLFLCVNNQQNQNVGQKVRFMQAIVDSPDTTPPVITSSIGGTLGQGGWYVSDVNVTFTTEDPESGIASESPECTGDNLIIVDTDSSGVTISCTATNGDGLSSTESVTIMRDATPPTIDDATIPTTVTDEIDEVPCSGLTCQADSEDGSVIIYAIPTASDSSPGSGLDGIVVCERDGIPGEANGTLFPITTPGFIPSSNVDCNISDLAGNPAQTKNFSVTVTPYLAFVPNDYDIGNSGTLIVSDPAQANTGTVFALVTSPTGLANGQSLQAELTEDTTNPGVFSTSSISFQDNMDTSDAAQILLTGVFDVVTATYPSSTPLSAAVTAPIGQQNPSGVTALLTDLDPVRFSSDIFSVGESGNLAHIKTGTNCSSLNPNIVDTVQARIFSLPEPDLDQITVTLFENSPSSCVFELPSLVRFTESEPSIGNSNEAGYPQLNVNRFTNVRGQISSGPTAGQQQTILIWAPPTFNPSAGIAVSTTGANCGANNDNDNDGICDSWENSGTGLIIPDPNGGTGVYVYPCSRLVNDPIRGPTDSLNTDPRNPVTCPSPDKKDIFIEMDFMLGHKPYRESTLQLVNAFQNAPEPINLFIQIDETYGFHTQSLPHDACIIGSPGCPTSYTQLKQQFWGTAQDRTSDINGNANEKLAAKRQAFRYMAMIHQQASNPSSSGYAEIKGNDIIISLGLFAAGIGSIDQQTGTMMHELGHSIGLNHGGGAANVQGCKPNHLSVMSYARQFSNIGGVSTNRDLDYSRENMGNLNEGGLNEISALTVSEHAGEKIVWANRNAGLGPLTQTLTSGVNSVDWNQANGLQANSAFNINDFNIFGCDGETQFGGAIDNLVGHDDWDALDLLMRDTAFFADGVKALNPLNISDPNDDRSAVELPDSESGSGVFEPTAIVNSPTGNEGDTVILDSNGSFDDPTEVPPGFIVDEIEGIPLRLWDINGNGVFDEPEDARGNTTPIFFDDDKSDTGASGPFFVELILWDNEDNDARATSTITINNVDPAVQAGADKTINEGDSISLEPATFSDPGIKDLGNTATIDWGDLSAIENCDNTTCLSETAGQAPDLVAGTPRVDTTGTVSGSHTYLDDAAYTVTVTVSDKDGGVGSDSLIITVNNIAPTLAALTNDAGGAVAAGIPINFASSWTDPGILDIITATFDWGDITADAANVTPNSGGSGNIAGTHTYSARGDYTVTLIADDGDGGSTSTTTIISVYSLDSFISPIANSQYQSGRTIPTKVTVLFADGSPVTTADVRVYIDNSPIDGTPGENPGVCNDGTNILTYDASGQFYSCNLSSAGISNGPHDIIAVLDGVSEISERIRIKG